MKLSLPALAMMASMLTPCLAATLRRQQATPGPNELWLCENLDYDKPHVKDLTMIPQAGGYGHNSTCMILDDTNLRPIPGEGVTSAIADPLWECSLYRNNTCTDQSPYGRFVIPKEGAPDLRQAQPESFDDAAVAYQCQPRREPNAPMA